MYLAQADVDLRLCDEESHTRCSYYTVYYGDKAKVIDQEITAEYYNAHQKFKAKVAIIQVSRHLFAPTHRTQASHCIDSLLAFHQIADLG